MIRIDRRSFVPLLLAAALISTPVLAQPCRSSSVTGASSTVNVAAGIVVGGTLASTDARDNSNFYELSPTGGSSTAPPSMRITTSSDVESQTKVLFGGVFSNPTDAPITVTQVDITTDLDAFKNLGKKLSPAGGKWTQISATNLRWTGALSVPAHDAERFLVESILLDFPNDTVNPRQVTVSATTSAGVFSFTRGINIRDAKQNAASTYAKFEPDINYLSVTGPVVDIPVEVKEIGGGGGTTSVNAGLLLMMSIPAGWSNVTAAVKKPWDPATLSIVQPTATTDGAVRIRLKDQLGNGGSTKNNTLVISATVPVLTDATLYPVTLALDGMSQGGKPITSINDAVVRVAGSGSGGPGGGTSSINVEFVSAAIGPGPVRQIDFRTDLNLINGATGDSVRVEVFNNVTAAWELISAVMPSSSNTAVQRMFTADFEPYVDATYRMRIRLVSTSTSARRLRIDFLQWSMITGYTVDNAIGLDTNVGNVARPFRTIGRAAELLGPSGAIYVEVGNAPYDANISIVSSGTSICQTLLQAVASGVARPLIRGLDPTLDSGFAVGADHVQVEGFRIENINVGLFSASGTNGTVFSNNSIQLSNGGYGVFLHTSSNALVTGNLADSSGASSFCGIFDFYGTSNRIESNRILGVPGLAGIYTETSSGSVLRGNVVQGTGGSEAGIHVARSIGGVTLYNNTVDSCFLGIFAEGTSGTVLSRNNNITNNGGTGWAWDSSGTVDSNYDNLFGYGSAYVYNSGTVTAGANSLSTDPLYVQTTDATQPTFYRLGSGSACINAGVDVGAPFLGVAPDIGAVETQ